MVLDSVLPVFLVIGLGSILARFRLTNETFLKTSDRLIYYIFFPVLLFWKIGSPAESSTIDARGYLAILVTILVAWVLSLLCKRAFKISDFEAGAFSQCCYRFNTYIGMAVVLNASGEPAVRQFGVIISFAIPFINLLSVSTLIWFSGRDISGSEKLRVTGKAIVSNPFILACFLGLLYARLGQPFPGFLENSFRLVSAVSLPMALISIGGAIHPAALRGRFKAALVASVFKVGLYPVMGYLVLMLFNVVDSFLSTAMLFFALPTSTASYVLSSQLDSDANLASSVIVLSTLLSTGSLSLAVWLFVP
ncbi:MAG: AEC family transporter [Deltaproteobacteria bacterium]|nr:AEC family transporter [Deltaproteobacteria bacterium]